MALILIVDDDSDFCYGLQRIVRRMGHNSESCGSIKECRRLLKEERFDAVFLDVILPDGNGLEILPELSLLPTSPETIIITGAGDSRGAELAITNGAWDYISKATSVKDITLTLKRALQYRNKRQLAATKSEKVALIRDSIIGQSGGVKGCLNQLAQCSGNDVNVIITGETGTGKELFARAIHNNSGRRGGPFVVVDCASLSESLVESILFGHRKGAFTGADNDSKGLVSSSHGGTLFLDEIGELSLSTQKTFLRLLQERTIRPVGSKEEFSCDFRLVAATNRDLEEMVDKKLFRSDLYFRLQSYHIHIPPLRERAEDVADIATFHVNAICDRLSLERKGVSGAYYENLREYSWPGNVRELVNCLEQTVVSAGNEPTLYPKHLPLNIRIQAKQANFPDSSGSALVPDRGGITVESADVTRETLQTYREAVYVKAERHYLECLMERCCGNMGEAIGLSGLSQSRLYALLKRYNLKPGKKTR